jgi:hypothetical protein
MLLEYINITNGTTILLPIKNITVPLTINWGDGSSPQTNITLDNPSYIYSSDIGTIQISISGNFTHFGVNNLSETVDSIDLLSRLISFNIISLNSLSGAFYNSISLIEVPNTLPSTITNLSYCFYGATLFNDPNIISWDISNVTNLDYLFFNAITFNQNIFNWNITNVTTLNFIFYGATSFKQPITGWLLNKILTFP